MSGYILDFFIICEYDIIVVGLLEVDCYLLDYVLILCWFNVLKFCWVVKEIIYCKIKFIDLDCFCEDFRLLELCNKIYLSLDDMVFGYDLFLFFIFDKYVFLKIKILVCRRWVLWFNSDIKFFIKVKRKVEKKWWFLKF